jgi:hypothetical protein
LLEFFFFLKDFIVLLFFLPFRFSCYANCRFGAFELEQHAGRIAVGIYAAATTVVAKSDGDQVIGRKAGAEHVDGARGRALWKDAAHGVVECVAALAAEEGVVAKVLVAVEGAEAGAWVAVVRIELDEDVLAVMMKRLALACHWLLCASWERRCC